MLEKRKPFRQVISALLGAMIGIAVACGAANAAEWPLVIPTKKLVNLPEGQGMPFFYGVWMAAGRNAPTSRMRIKAGRIEAGNPVYYAENYRVLYEGSNYVLAVQRYDPPDVEYPTTFSIYALQGFGWPANQDAELRLYSCTYGTWGTREAFDWPVEKLIETFKTSMCFDLIDLDDSISIGWGSSRLIRVPEN